MPNSENRILTTHAGSLPRPKDLVAMFGRKSRHEPVDEAALEQMAAESTSRVIARQLECGIDIGNNGEQARESFFTYVQHRMSRILGQKSASVHERPDSVSRLPAFHRRRCAVELQVDLMHAPQATGEIRYTGLEAVKKECADFRRALDEQKSQFVETVHDRALRRESLRPRCSTRTIRVSHEYVKALGAAFKTEYETIVEFGIRAPDRCARSRDGTSHQLLRASR